MQQGDYSAYYHQFPHLQNPNSNPIPNPSPAPADLHQSAYASAPPFNTSYAPSDYSSYSTNYPPYPQNPDPVPPTAPSFNPVTTPPPTTPTLNQPPAPASSYAPYDSHGPYQQSGAQQPYYPLFDQQQTAPNYAPPPPAPSTFPANPNPIPNSNLSYSSIYSTPSSHVGSSMAPVYDNPYESSLKFDQGGGYFDEKYGGYNRSRAELGSDLYWKQSDSGYSRYDDGYSDGVYAYEGGKVEPYGARGTAPKSSTWAVFDDYGRSISVPSGKDSTLGSGSAKIVRAIPKAETQQDVKSGVQKFRVKLLPESGGQSTMDVLCQIGLDGIRMLDPSTSRTLRIYPLENITRCDVTDSSTFAFWSKSSVDIEPRRIRLQSNSYTTNTLLDTVTAATVQWKEMGGRSRPSDNIKTPEQPAEKKKGFGEWMNLIKPPNEEKEHWVPDEAVSKCTACGTDFGAFVRKHHCRNCGDIFCDKCTHGRIALTADENAQPVRVCDRCMAEVTQRLSNAKEAASKPASLQSHEDLARKLQEEMEKNRKSSSGSRSDGSGRRMKEVACPTCTVHLQVQVQWPDINLKEIAENFSKLACNAHTICDSELRPLGTGLYPVVSIINHSCIPNAVLVFEGRVAVVRAVQHISKGSEVLISYIETAGSTMTRQKALKEQYFFNCSCSRCIKVGMFDDIQESAMLEGYRCADDRCSGFLLRDSDSRGFVCQKCGHLRNKEEIKQIAGEIKTLTDKAPTSPCPGNHQEAIMVYKTIEKLQVKLCHPFSINLMRTRERLLKLLMEVEDWREALAYCRLTIPVYQRVYPEFHPLLGLQYYTCGKLEWLLGDTQNAVKSLTKAVDILRITHGTNTLFMKDLLIKLEEARAEASYKLSCNNDE